MVVTILTSLVVFLALVLGFDITMRYYAWKKRKDKKKSRKAMLWETVFDRTDLKKEMGTAVAEEAA